MTLVACLNFGQVALNEKTTAQTEARVEAGDLG